MLLSLGGGYEPRELSLVPLQLFKCPCLSSGLETNHHTLKEGEEMELYSRQAMISHDIHVMGLVTNK